MCKAELQARFNNFHYTTYTKRFKLTQSKVYF